MDSTTYYAVLGCARMSSTEQINVEFRRLAVLHHPDKCANDPEAAARFALMQDARSVLTSDVQRPLYDAWLDSGLQVSFVEYRALRERGGWHWKDEPHVGQLLAGDTQVQKQQAAPASAAATETVRRPRFSGSDSRHEMIRRFRNNDL